MFKREHRWWILTCVLAALPTILLAQEGLSKSEGMAWSGVVKMIPEIYKALKSDEALPLLMVACNTIVALLKTRWFRGVAAKVARRQSHIELTKAGKVTLALITGVVLVWVFSPAATGLRTLGKGLMLGFAAVGFFNVWKYTFRDVFIRDVPDAPEDPPPEDPPEEDAEEEDLELDEDPDEAEDA